MTPRASFTVMLLLSSISCGESGLGGAVDAGGAGGGGASVGDGSGETSAGNDGGGETSAGGDAGGTSLAGLCEEDPTPGSFVFSVHNGTSKAFVWSYGCGDDVPIDIDTPAGAQPAGPGRHDFCGVTCGQVYAGASPGGCTDCDAPGVVTAPGASTSITWDRRVFTEQPITAACSTRFADEMCAHAQAVAPNATQQGTLIVCDDYIANGCTNPRRVPFTIDTTAATGTIEVR
jgi:hypothetical protein